MEKHFIILVFSFIMNFTLGCSETKQKTRSEIYSEKTAELINNILKEEGNQICDCILEPKNESMYYIFKRDFSLFDFENYIVEKLNLKSTADIDSLYGINEKLILYPKLITERIKIVTRKEYDSIYNKYEFEEAREILYYTYPNLCYFTKPIFDKDFKNGLFDLKFGGSHLMTPPPKIKNVQGVWEYDWN